MANVFVSLPVPAGDGVGAAIDTSGAGPDKTLVISGSFTSLITIEASEDGVLFEAVKSYTGPTSDILTVEAFRMRVRVSQTPPLGSLTPTVDLGADGLTGAFSTFVMPVGDGVSPAVSVATLGETKTIVVGGTFEAVVTMEISENGVDFSSFPKMPSFTGPSLFTANATAQLVRARVSGYVSGTPLATIGAAPPAGASPPPPVPAPIVTAYDPPSGRAGDSVTVFGFYFKGTTAVDVNGTPVASFFVRSDGEIEIVLPAGFTTGPIHVTTPSGTGTGPPFTKLSSDEWVLAANLNTARIDMAWDNLSGAPFVACGNDGVGGTLQSTELLDLAGNAWNVKAPVPVDARWDVTQPQGVTLADGTFLLVPFIAGATPSKVPLYSPGPDTWGDSVGAGFPTNTNYAGGGEHDIYRVDFGPQTGDDLVGPGLVAGDGISREYNVAAGFGNDSPLVNQDSTQNCATCKTADGHVFAAGGTGGFSIFIRLQEWNPVTNVWTARANLPFPIHGGHRLIEITSGPEAGNLLLVGGSNQNYTLPIPAGSSGTLIYRRAADAWVPGPTMAVGRYDPVLVRLGDNRVMVAGGNPANPSVQFLDEAASVLAWIAGPPMPWNGQAMGFSLIATWFGNPALLAIFGGYENNAAVTAKTAVFRLQP